MLCSVAEVEQEMRASFLQNIIRMSTLAAVVCLVRYFDPSIGATSGDGNVRWKSADFDSFNSTDIMTYAAWSDEGACGFYQGKYDTRNC